MSQIKAEISLHTYLKLIFHKNVGWQGYQWGRGGIFPKKDRDISMLLNSMHDHNSKGYILYSKKSKK